MLFPWALRLGWINWWFLSIIVLFILSILWTRGLIFKTKGELLSSEISEKLKTIDQDIIKHENLPLPLLEVEVPRLDEPIQVNVVHSDSPVNLKVLPNDKHIDLNNKTSVTVSTLYAAEACLLGRAPRCKPILRRSAFLLRSRLQTYSPPEIIEQEIIRQETYVQETTVKEIVVEETVIEEIIVPETSAVEAFALETSVTEEVYGFPLLLEEVGVLQTDELVDLGFEEKNSGNFEQAAAYFSNALSRDPKPDLAFYLIIDSYWLWNNLGKNEYALTQLRTHVHKYLPLFNTELRLQFDNWMVKENLVNSFN